MARRQEGRKPSKDVEISDRQVFKTEKVGNSTRTRIVREVQIKSKGTIESRSITYIDYVRSSSGEIRGSVHRAELDKNGRVTKQEHYQIEKTRYSSRAEMKDAPGNLHSGRGYWAERDANEMLREQRIQVEYREGRQRWSPEFGLIPGDYERPSIRPEKSPPLAVPEKDARTHTRPEKAAPQRPEKQLETPRETKRDNIADRGSRDREPITPREARAAPRPTPHSNELSTSDNEGYWSHGGRNLVMGAAAVGVGVMSAVALAGAAPAVGAAAVSLAVIEGLSAGLGMATGITAIGVGVSQAASLTFGSPTKANELNSTVELVLDLGSTLGLAGGVIAQISGVPLEKGAKFGSNVETFGNFGKTVLSKEVDRDAELSKGILDYIKGSSENIGKPEDEKKK